MHIYVYIYIYIHIYIYIRLHIPYIAIMNLQTGIDKLGRGGRTGVQLNMLGTPWMVAGIELVTSGNLGCFICCCQWLNIIECSYGMCNCVWETIPSDEWEDILYNYIYHIYIYTQYIKITDCPLDFPLPCDFHWRLGQITEVFRWSSWLPWSAEILTAGFQDPLGTWVSENQTWTKSAIVQQGQSEVLQDMVSWCFICPQ